MASTSLAPRPIELPYSNSRCSDRTVVTAAVYSSLNNINSDLSQTSVRQRTYKQFPIFHVYWINPIDMVDTGFYCTGHGDEVKCFSCHVPYRNWKKEDKPAVVHRRLSPSCRFLRGIINEPDYVSDDSDVSDEEEGCDDVDSLHDYGGDVVDGAVGVVNNSNNSSTHSSLEADGCSHNSRLHTDASVLNRAAVTSSPINSQRRNLETSTTTTSSKVFSELFYDTYIYNYYHTGLVAYRTR